MNTLKVFSVVFAIGVTSLLAGSVQQQQDEGKKKDDGIVVPDKGPEAIARRDFMRAKLMFSKNLLEGLTTGDFKLINIAVGDLKTVTEGEQWVEIDNERYRKLTMEFQSAVQRLEDAAKTGNTEATALRYYQVSTSCIDCHRHIRKANYDL